MRVARDDIAEVVTTGRKQTPIESARRRGISVSVAEPEMASSEINVIGKTADEARAMTS